MRQGVVEIKIEFFSESLADGKRSGMSYKKNYRKEKKSF
jgi:hypothetical protein